MKSFNTIAALAAISSVFAAPTEEVARRASSITPITIKGNAFFQGSNRFYMRGVDYQPGGAANPIDPISNTENCERDIKYFQTLGINTVRVYTVDNSANHDACMTALANAGIYLVLDVNSGKYSINRLDAKSANISYNSDYLQNVFATIDAFASYPNTLALFSGNEVINDDVTTEVAPYVKAVTRDMRSYIAARKYRQIPVGYSAADVDSNRLEMAEYMNCGSDDERSDFYAFNDYSWCDPSSFHQSGWDQKVKNFTNYGLPLFLSEYGCIKGSGRKWEEVASLYSTDMSAVYSGGLVYEYSEEPDNPGFGLVTISGQTITPKTDFTLLQAAFKAQSNPSGDGGYNATGGASSCPPQSANWNVPNDALPAIPVAAKAYMTSGAGKGVGLSGPGSQDGTMVAGGQSAGVSAAGSGTGGAPGTSTGSGSAASATKKGSASSLQTMDKSPFFLAVIVVAFSFVGATLL
jgi:hypothetical protein